MTKLKLLGAAAIVLTSALAGPVTAQEVVTNPGKCAQFYPNANCQNLGPGNPYTDGGYQRRTADNGWNNNGWNNGWNNGGLAAGVVGGAVGTAGAIAAAPFQSNSYAYYNNGYNSGFNGYNQSYAQRNGFVCQPGTWFKGDDGRQHPCQ
jgi:hypothetical protein